MIQRYLCRAAIINGKLSIVVGIVWGGCWVLRIWVIGIWAVGIWRNVVGIGGDDGGELVLDVEIHPDGVAAGAAAAEHVAAQSRLVEAVTAIGVELLHHEAFAAPKPATAQQQP
jgi:hypothetical protein